MKCLDRFNNKMSLSGGSLRNENVKNSREMEERYMLLEELLKEEYNRGKGAGNGYYL